MREVFGVAALVAVLAAVAFASSAGAHRNVCDTPAHVSVRPRDLPVAWDAVRVSDGARANARFKTRVVYLAVSTGAIGRGWFAS